MPAAAPAAARPGGCWPTGRPATARPPGSAWPSAAGGAGERGSRRTCAVPWRLPGAKIPAPPLPAAAAPRLARDTTRHGIVRPRRQSGGGFRQEWPGRGTSPKPHDAPEKPAYGERPSNAHPSPPRTDYRPRARHCRRHGLQPGPRRGLPAQGKQRQGPGPLDGRRRVGQGRRLGRGQQPGRSEEHTPELQSLMRISPPVFYTYRHTLFLPVPRPTGPTRTTHPRNLPTERDPAMHTQPRRVQITALALGIAGSMAFSQAHAAAFLLKENSVKAQGRSMAGAASAKGDASVVANNPAVMSTFDKNTFQADVTAIDLSFKFNGGGSAAAGSPLAQPLTGGNGSDAGGLNVVPAMSFIKPLSGQFEYVTLGAMISAPFGLKTE